jgi:hypothetical protein
MLRPFARASAGALYQHRSSILKINRGYQSMQPLLRLVDSCAPQNFRPRYIPDRDRKTSSLQFSRFSSSLREKRNFSQRVSLELLDALHAY